MDVENAEFKRFFEIEFPGFIEGLNDMYPNLSNGEEKLILLMFLRLEHVQIAGVLGISDQSARKKQQRSKKKLALDNGTSLSGFVFSLETTLLHVRK